MSAAASAPSEQHALTLKVMRLSRPGFAEQSPRMHEPDDLLGARPAPLSAYSLPAAAHPPARGGAARIEPPTSPLAPAPEAAAFAVSDMMRLPLNFGTIYLGEVFSSYVCVNNESSAPVRDVAVKAELQTTSQRFVLADSTERPRHEMHPADLVDVVVTHEIKELGVHILVCSVSYTTARDERKFFRKFFRFQVANPLTVKTKVYNQRSLVFLEAQIQNVTPRMMYLESVRFEPSSLFSSADLNTVGTTRGDRRKDLSGVFLAPQDLRQYLYKLTPLESARAEAKIATGIGKLDIVWKTTMGEKGRLQTSQLPRKVPQLDAVEVAVASVPPEVLVQQHFVVALEVRNCTAQPMRLSLSVAKGKLQSLWPVGLTSLNVGDVQPHQAATVRLPYVALAPGLLRLGGLVVADTISGRVAELDHVGDVLVHRVAPSAAV